MFQQLSSGGTVGVIAKEYPAANIAKLTKILSPHRFQENDNVYGMNNVRKLYADSAVDHGAWPRFSPIAPTVGGNGPEEYYSHLAEQLVCQYTDNAVAKGHMLTHAQVTKDVPVFDVTKIYRKTGPERFAFPEMYFYEDQVDQMRFYGWTAFLPCLNRFTVRLNTHRFVHVELLQLTSEYKAYTARISDYAGNRYRWIKQGEASFIMQFTPPDGQDGLLLPMQYAAMDSQGYEEFLTQYVDEMKWDKRTKEFWYDLFGVRPLDKMIILKLTPNRELRSVDDVPADMKRDVVTMVYDKRDIATIHKVCSMDVAVKSSGEEAKAVYDREIASAMVLTHLKAVMTVNLELASSPRDAAALSVPGKGTYEVGRMTVTASEPMAIRVPKTIIRKEVRQE